MEIKEKIKTQFFKTFKRKADGVDGPVIRACVYDGKNRDGIERLCGNRGVFESNEVAVGDYIVEQPYLPYTIKVEKPDVFESAHFPFDAAGLLSGGLCVPQNGTVIVLTPNHSWWNEIGNKLAGDDYNTLTAAVDNSESKTIRVYSRDKKVFAEIPGKDLEITYIYK